MSEIDVLSRSQRIAVKPPEPTGVVVVSKTQRIIVHQDKSVSVVNAGPIGPPGMRGPAGPESSYAHTQSNPSLVWTIQHNLGFHPAGVKSYDFNGQSVDGLVTYMSDNVLLITFLSARSGVAYIS